MEGPLVDLLNNAVTYIHGLPAQYADWWWQQWYGATWHVVTETSLIVFILYVLFVKRSYNPVKRGFGDRAPDDELTPAEVDAMAEKWKPEPLVPGMPAGGDPLERQVVIEEVQGHMLTVAGHDGPVLNMASGDFLGIGGEPGIKDVARDTLNEYGCGTCGPRGFYGTSKKHTEIEDALAVFMDCDEAITYSDAVSCVASAIPAFAKKGDLLIVDDGVNHAVQTGCTLSRSRIMYWRHNDPDDLERVLREATAHDRRTGANLKQRRFIVGEGLYRNYGDIMPLPEVLELRAKYKVRLLVDESLSFGVLGENGRGLTEHFGRPVSDIDVMVASMATSLASIGGFCASSREVVDHQRLSSAGYCFSASAPPFLVAAAHHALERMQEEPSLLTDLQSNVGRALDGLGGIPGLQVESCEASPLIHMRFSGLDDVDDVGQDALMQRLHEACLDAGVLVAKSHYLTAERSPPPPSLKVLITAAHSHAEIDYAVGAITEAANEILSGGGSGSRPSRSATNGAGAGAGAGAGSGKVGATPRSRGGRRR